MNNEYKPVLICNGDEKHLREDGELTCGGCGYIFDSKSTEYFFNSIEIKPDCISGETKGRWYDIPLFARDNPWHIVCLALTKEHAALAKEMINNDENSF